jgi:hypothetical protein
MFGAWAWLARCVQASLCKERRVKTRSYASYEAQPEWRGASSAAGGELEKIRRSLELAGRLSDRIIPLGPWGLGIDALLNFIPGVGEAYSAIVGGFILIQGARAKAPFHILIVAASLLASRTVITAVPLAGPFAADALTAHRWAARLIVKSIEKKIARGER